MINWTVSDQFEYSDISEQPLIVRSMLNAETDMHEFVEFFGKPVDRATQFNKKMVQCGIQTEPQLEWL